MYDSAAWDAIVIGAGPAGLTAALYLGRFERRVLVVDNGQSRAALIKRSHNVPGFPGGVSGASLLRMLRKQCAASHVHFVHDTATHVAAIGDKFEIASSTGLLRSKAVLLAVGVTDHPPDLPDYERALAAGLLRYCPICDGHEARNRPIAVIGEDNHGANEALFLQAYSNDITLIPHRTWTHFADRADLEAKGIRVVDHPVTAWRRRGPAIELQFGSGDVTAFHRVYAALGSSPRLGAAALPRALLLTPAGCLVTDKHQETSVRNLFAAGDLVEGLDQISVAFGQGAIAAVAIHNRLRTEPQSRVPERYFPAPKS